MAQLAIKSDDAIVSVVNDNGISEKVCYAHDGKWQPFNGQLWRVLKMEQEGQLPLLVK